MCLPSCCFFLLFSFVCRSIFNLSGLNGNVLELHAGVSQWHLLMTNTITLRPRYGSDHLSWKSRVGHMKGAPSDHQSHVKRISGDNIWGPPLISSLLLHPHDTSDLDFTLGGRGCTETMKEPQEGHGMESNDTAMIWEGQVFFMPLVHFKKGTWSSVLKISRVLLRWCVTWLSHWTPLQSEERFS